MKIVAAYCICLGLIRIAGSYPDTRSPRKSLGKCSVGPTDPRPCKDQKSNKTIITALGQVNCVVPSKEQLLSMLKDIGGANPSYVATTAEEAEKFPNLLPNVSESKIVVIKRQFKLPWWRRGFEHNLHLAKRSSFTGSTVTTVRCVLNNEIDITTNGKVMCTRCQQTRELDATRYFPTKLNELSCGHGTIRGVSSMVCSRRGECFQKKLFLPMLEYKNDTCTTSGGRETCKQNWIPIEYKLPSCCECQIPV